jgi:integrase
MPAEVAVALQAQDLLRVSGPHAPSTVKRRLAHCGGTLHRQRSVAGSFKSPHVRAAIRLAVRASTRPRTRKSKRSLTTDMLEKLLQPCVLERFVDVRNRALLLVALTSGGRRRGEVARLRVEPRIPQDPVPAQPEDPDSPKLACIAVQLGRTKTGVADEDRRVLLIGRSADALVTWLARRSAQERCFGASTAGGTLESTALSPQAMNLILKKGRGWLAWMG